MLLVIRSRRGRERERESERERQRESERERQREIQRQREGGRQTETDKDRQTDKEKEYVFVCVRARVEEGWGKESSLRWPGNKILLDIISLVVGTCT